MENDMFDINEYLRDLEYLVNIDSGQDAPEGITKVAEFFREKFDGMGWNTTMHDLSPNTGNCLICTNREADHYDLMLIGHTDTVFAKGTAAERPFSMDETKAYGPGVSDMKSGSLMMYYILRDLPKEVTDKLNIVVVYNPDEEIGSIYSYNIYEEYAKKTKYAYVYEAQSEDYACCIERKGMISFSVVIHGIAGHVGYTFTNKTLNAVIEASRWALRIQELESRERNVNVNVTRIHGGEKMNVIPDEAGFSVNMRVPNNAEIDYAKTVLDRLKAEADERGYTAKIQILEYIDPLVPSDEGYAYVGHLNDVAKSIGRDLKFKPKGGLSDANQIQKHGTICIDAMGPAGTNAHSISEFMLLESIVPTYELSTAMITDLASNKL